MRETSSNLIKKINFKEKIAFFGDGKWKHVEIENELYVRIIMQIKKKQRAPHNIQGFMYTRYLLRWHI